MRTFLRLSKGPQTNFARYSYSNGQRQFSFYTASDYNEKYKHELETQNEVRN